MSLDHSRNTVKKREDNSTITIARMQAKETKRAHPYKKASQKKQGKSTILIDPLPLKEMKKMKGQIEVVSSSEEVPNTVVHSETTSGPVVPFTEGTGTFHYSSLEEVLDSLQMTYPCPVHRTDLEEVTSKQEDEIKVFLRCPEPNCPVFCCKDDVIWYSDQCKKQAYEWFTLGRIAKMVCQCGDALSLSISKSDKTYGRMYLRCGERNCDLFCWWAFKPSKKNTAILAALMNGEE